MIAYCYLCQSAYQIAGEPEEVHRLLDTPEWKEFLPCATTRCLGRAVRVSLDWVVANKGLIRKTEGLPLETYYRAINGFGRPDQVPSDLPAVKSELVGKKVVFVDGYSVGDPARTILRKLVMDDGTMLHFASSTHGACIFAISEPGPTCVEVFDDQLAEANSHPGVFEQGARPTQGREHDSDRDDPGVGSGGEEGGRVVEDAEGPGAAGASSAAGQHRADVPPLSESSSVHPIAKRRG